MTATLDFKMNQANLLSRLANNLNIPSVNDTSNIKKISDAFQGEMVNLELLSNNTINNSIISRMTTDSLEDFASSIGVTRLRYGALKLKSSDFVASLYLESANRYDPTLKDVTLFFNGDVIYSNGVFTVRTLEDIVLKTTEEIIYPNLEIRLNSTANSDSFTISQYTTLDIKPSEEIIAKGIPELTLLFNYPVGLAFLTEDIDDFKNRVYDTLAMANNAANSLIFSIVRETPMLYKIEIDNIEEGRAISVIYPYTREMVEDNDSTRLNSILVPLINTSLSNKYKFNMVYVRTPTPIKLTVQLKTTAMPTLLDNIRKELNIDYKDNDFILVKDIRESILSKLQNNATDLKVMYGSDLINYGGFELEDSEIIEIPIGKFLNITSILKVNSQ